MTVLMLLVSISEFIICDFLSSKGDFRICDAFHIVGIVMMLGIHRSLVAYTSLLYMEFTGSPIRYVSPKWDIVFKFFSCMTPSVS